MKKSLAIFIILSLLIATATSAAATTVTRTWFHTSAGMEDAGLTYPDTTGFVYSPNYAVDHTVFAGTYNGVFKSIDSGVTWTASSVGLDNDHVNSLAISPNYASDHSLAAGTGGGVFLSIDYGAHWADISGTDLSALPDTTIEVVKYHPNYNASTNPTLIVGTSGHGVYETTAIPRNWAAMGTAGLCDERVLDLAFTPDYATNSAGYLFAALDWTGGSYECGGVFKIKKSETVWTALNTGFPAETDLVFNALAISPNFANDQTIFVSIGFGNGVYRTTNGGGSWILMADTAGFYNQSLAISPYYPCDGTIFAGTDNNGVYVSRNKGASWIGMNAGGFAGGKDVLSIVVAPGKSSSPALNLFAGANGDGAWQYIYPHACIYLPLLKK